MKIFTKRFQIVASCSRATPSTYPFWRYNLYIAYKPVLFERFKLEFHLGNLFSVYPKFEKISKETSFWLNHDARRKNCSHL